METDDKRATQSKHGPLEIRGWYRVIRGIIGFLLRLLSRLDITGQEHIPAVGPYLLVTNHLHWLDPPALMAVFPHRTYVFAAEKWEHHWFYGPFFRSLDAIFVHRGEVDRAALRRALEVLEAGCILGLAPEGTRSRVGTMQKGRSGAAYLAYRSGVQVLPVVCTGQEFVFTNVRRLRKARVQIRFGPPFKPPRPADGGKVSPEEVRAFTDEIMYRLAALLPAEYRGVYADVEQKRPDLMAPAVNVG